MAITAVAAPADEPEEPALETLRNRLAAAAPTWADDAIKGLQDALKATKRVRVQRVCLKPGCGCSHIEYAEVQDSAKVLDALKLAIEQTEGRPGVAESDSNIGVTIVRQLAHDTDLEAALEGRAEQPPVTHTRPVDGQLPLSQAPEPRP